MADPMTDRPVDDRTAILGRVRAEIHEVVDTHLPAGARVAFLNFPNHRNAGDDAIWLGGEEVLARQGRRIAYRAAWNSLSPRRLDKALGSDGWIVLSGGGNFGDLYPGGQQALRARVLHEWRDRPILQLPQSIHFGDPAAREAMGTLVGDHGGMTILCRDQASLDIAREWDATVAFCPDLAFLVGPFDRPEPKVDVVWLGRGDGERLFDRPDPADDLWIDDWLGDTDVDGDLPVSRDLARARRRVGKYVGFDPAGTHYVDHPLYSRLGSSGFRAVAEGWVDRGVAILGRGRVVVTDRLHAHVLAWLAGVPSVVLDNSYGKVRGVISTTTADSALTYFADSTDQALALARRLAAVQAGAEAS